MVLAGGKVVDRDPDLFEIDPDVVDRELALSDIVTDGPLPQEIKDSLSAWAGCVAGALDVKDYIAGLEAAGFSKVDVTPVYFDQETVDEYLKQANESSCCGPSQKVVISDGVRATVVELKEPLELTSKPIREAVFSAKITATK